MKGQAGWMEIQSSRFPSRLFLYCFFVERALPEFEKPISTLAEIIFFGTQGPQVETHVRALAAAEVRRPTL